MPSTGRALAREVGLRWRGAETLKVPAHNVRLGLRYLWKLERQFRNPYLAMVAYNMGPARAVGMPRERARSSRYVRKILDRYERLLKRHAERA
jgi:soluble lytic murein transglycosylase-like protein